MLQPSKQLVKNSALYAVGDIAVKGLGFLLTPIYTRFLNPKEYGIYAITSVIGSLLAFIYSSFSLGPITRFFFDLNDERERKRFFGTVWLFVLVQGLVLTLILEGVGTPLAALMLRNVPYTPYLRYTIWTALVNSIVVSVPLPLFRAREQAGRYVAFSVPIFFVKTLFIVFFVVIRKEGVIGLLRGELFGSLVLIAPAMIVTLRNISLSWSWLYLKDILTFGLPLILNQLAQWGLRVSDRIVLERFVTLDQVGIYSLGYLFGTALSLVSGAANTAWVPFFLGNVVKGKSTERGDISRLITYYWGAIATAGVLVSLLARPVIRIVARPDYYSAERMVPWVVLGVAALGFYSVPAAVLFYAKKTHLMSLSTVSGAVVNLVLNFLLVPRYGIMAAAVNTFLAYSVTLLIAMLCASRIGIIRYERVRIVKLFASSLVTYAVGGLVVMSSPYLEFAIRALVVPIGVLVSLQVLSFYSQSEKVVVSHLIGALGKVFLSS